LFPESIPNALSFAPTPPSFTGLSNVRKKQNHFSLFLVFLLVVLLSILLTFVVFLPLFFFSAAGCSFPPHLPTLSPSTASAFPSSSYLSPNSSSSSPVYSFFLRHPQFPSSLLTSPSASYSPVSFLTASLSSSSSFNSSSNETSSSPPSPSSPPISFSRYAPTSQRSYQFVCRFFIQPSPSLTSSSFSSFDNSDSSSIPYYFDPIRNLFVSNFSLSSSSPSPSPGSSSSLFPDSLVGLPHGFDSLATFHPSLDLFTCSLPIPPPSPYLSYLVNNYTNDRLANETAASYSYYYPFSSFPPQNLSIRVQLFELFVDPVFLSPLSPLSSIYSLLPPDSSSPSSFSSLSSSLPSLTELAQNNTDYILCDLISNACLPLPDSVLSPSFTSSSPASTSTVSLIYQRPLSSSASDPVFLQSFPVSSFIFTHFDLTKQQQRFSESNSTQLPEPTRTAWDREINRTICRDCSRFSALSCTRVRLL
jgi:hypothetical protein